MFLVDVDEFHLKFGPFPNRTLYSPECTHFRLRPIVCAAVDGFLYWCVIPTRGLINKLFRGKAFYFML